MQNHSRKYWIVVVSREHAMRGVNGGFMQVCHGKKGPLARMKKDDIMIVYSPKLTMEGSEKYQKFVALGKVSDDSLYEFQMTPDFRPFRRNIQFYDITETSIIPLISHLSFITDPKHWGYPFRFGILEISEIDFNYISSTMGFYETRNSI